MATERKWDDLRARLMSLGWRTQVEEGSEGLSSPNDALFIDAGTLEPRARALLVSSLSRKVASIEDYRAQGFYPPEVESAHRDFQQVLQCLAELPED